MRVIILSLIIIAFVTPKIIHSEIIRISLPHAKGIYIGNGTFAREVSFQLDPIPTHINHAWIQLSGDFYSGLIKCPGDNTILSGGLFFSVMRTSPETGSWWARFYIEPEAHDYTDTAFFRSLLGATWNFLADGKGKIIFGLNYGAGMPVCVILRQSIASIEEAYLYLDADFAVPIENHTWGTIKQLFSN